jgi:hypothetical protein
MSTKYGKLLKNKNYCKDLASTIVNRFGDSVDAIASSWIVYELTGQAAWSAIIYAINRLPTIIVTPLVGPTLALLTTALGLGISLGNMYISVEMFNVIDKSYLARVSGIGAAISSGITPVTAFIIGIVVKFSSTRAIMIIAGVIAFLFGIYMLTTGTKVIEEAEKQNIEKNAQTETLANNQKTA